MYKEMMDTIGLVNTVDPELGAAMNRELTRQRQNIELIARRKSGHRRPLYPRAGGGGGKSAPCFYQR